MCQIPSGLQQRLPSKALSSIISATIWRDTTRMNPLLEAAQEVCEFLSEQAWEYCLIGGLAVQKWGEPRTTLDADITLFTGMGREEEFVDPTLGHFSGRLPNAREFALANRVLLVRAANGTDIDIVLGALPFEAEMIRRAKPVEFAPGVELVCCSPEDSFIMKAFAGRPRDWLDAESIASRQSNLDNKYILEQLEPLCALKDAPELYEKAKRILTEKR